MLELRIITTDQRFVDELNAAGIEGARAVYRPTMAYDSAEHILEIVVTAATAAVLKMVGDWIIDRRKTKPPSQITINNQTIINAEQVVTVIQNCIDGDRDKDKKKE